LEYDNTLANLFGKAPLSAEGFPDSDVLSDALVTRYWEASAEIAAGIADKGLGTFLAGACDPSKGATDDKCLAGLTGPFLKRAYRRPPDAGEVALIRKVYNDGKAAGGMKGGVRFALSVVLQSPQFLYLAEGGTKVEPDGTIRLTGPEVASRLSYALLGGPPSDDLMGAAERGELVTSAGVRAVARRLFGAASSGSPEGLKVRARVRDFLMQWSEADSIPDLSKDASYVKGFTSQIASAMKSELVAFLEHTVWTEGLSVRATLTAPVSFMTPELARFYGMPAGPGGLTKVTLDGRQRAGLLTQGGLLSALATQQESSPIHRGKFIAGHLLCSLPPPPPPGSVPQLPKPSASQSMRDRLAAHSADPACAGCHTFLDPLGLGLEHFDAAGRWRDTEAGKPVDARGRIPGWSDGQFDGAIQLGQKLGESPQVAGCILSQWHRYAYGRDVDAELDACSVARMRKRLEGGGRWEDILLSFIESDTFTHARTR
jgi:hypothetical protein